MGFLIGLLGKMGLGWLLNFFSGGFFGALGTMIAAAFAELVRLAGIFFGWLLKIVLDGVDHILKSVKATAVVLAICWIAFGYGRFIAPVKVERVVVDHPNVTGPDVPSRASKTILDEVFGTLF